jgi:hypothetical protein
MTTPAKTSTNRAIATRAMDCQRILRNWYEPVTSFQ